MSLWGGAVDQAQGSDSFTKCSCPKPTPINTTTKGQKEQCTQRETAQLTICVTHPPNLPKLWNTAHVVPRPLSTAFTAFPARSLQEKDTSSCPPEAASLAHCYWLSTIYSHSHGFKDLLRAAQAAEMTMGAAGLCPTLCVPGRPSATSSYA